jgi:hypothetical protein
LAADYPDILLQYYHPVAITPPADAQHYYCTAVAKGFAGTSGNLRVSPLSFFLSVFPPPPPLQRREEKKGKKKERD